eukprot:11598179-Prorocentrum_lima.AAC.1
MEWQADSVEPLKGVSTTTIGGSAQTFQGLLRFLCWKHPATLIFENVGALLRQRSPTALLARACAA